MAHGILCIVFWNESLISFMRCRKSCWGHSKTIRTLNGMCIELIKNLSYRTIRVWDSHPVTQGNIIRHHWQWPRSMPDLSIIPVSSLWRYVHWQRLTRTFENENKNWIKLERLAVERHTLTFQWCIVRQSFAWPSNHFNPFWSFFFYLFLFHCNSNSNGNFDLQLSHIEKDTDFECEMEFQQQLTGGKMQ